MHPDFRRVLVLILLIAVIGAGYWYYRRPAAPAPTALTASGTIEATELIVASEVPGQVVDVAAGEGDEVAAGQRLVQLDDSLAKAQRQQAEAAHKAAASLARAAAANLAFLKSGPSPEQLVVSRTLVDKAKLAVGDFQEAYDALTPTLRSLPVGQTLQQQLDQAKASLANAQAQHDLLRVGAGAKQIEAAQAQADAAQAQAEAAQAALGVADVQAERLGLRSPISGTVLSRSVEPGAVILPGAPLLTIADLSRLAITVYVPEDRYGEVALDQVASLQVDSFPNRRFTATVVRIADQAAFTPRNVQTAEGRKTTVFAVKLAVDNPGDRLKPGMPADVTFPER